MLPDIWQHRFVLPEHGTTKKERLIRTLFTKNKTNQSLSKLDLIGNVRPFSGRGFDRIAIKSNILQYGFIEAAEFD